MGWYYFLTLPPKSVYSFQILGFHTGPDLGLYSSAILAYVKEAAYGRDHFFGKQIYMEFPNRLAVLLDGEWIRKTLYEGGNPSPSPHDLANVVHEITERSSDLSDYKIYRVFYYTARPLGSKAKHPLTGKEIDFKKTSVYKANQQFISQLELQPNFAIREGQLRIRGWKIKEPIAPTSSTPMQSYQITIGPDDMVPNIQQKGVDICIGVDLAVLATKRLVSSVLIITGDTDMIPAFKLARTEGLRVYLATLGVQVRSELRAHADVVIDSPPSIVVRK